MNELAITKMADRPRPWQAKRPFWVPAAGAAPPYSG